MKLYANLLLTMALSLCAAAQTTSNISTVTLSGNPDNPVIENHSGREVIAAMVVFTLSSGVPAVSQHLFDQIPNELADGKSERFGKYGRNSTGIAAKLTAVIFADGELRGATDHNFRESMERHIHSQQQVLQMAKDGNWAGVQAKSDAKPGDPGFDSVAGSLLAYKLLMDRSKNGDAGAVKLHEHVSEFPANIWQGGQLNRLFRGHEILAALGEWLLPTVYAQGSPYRDVVTHPFQTYDPPYYPSQWTYYCQTHLIGSDNAPCPDVAGTVPSLGIAALCVSGVYDIGDQVSLGIDKYYNLIQEGATDGHDHLVQQGTCTDQFTGNRETWEYDKYCTGPSDPVPVKNYDTTGFVCGAGVLGY